MRTTTASIWVCPEISEMGYTIPSKWQFEWKTEGLNHPRCIALQPAVQADFAGCSSVPPPKNGVYSWSRTISFHGDGSKHVKTLSPWWTPSHSWDLWMWITHYSHVSIGIDPYPISSIPQLNWGHPLAPRFESSGGKTSVTIQERDSMWLWKRHEIFCASACGSPSKVNQKNTDVVMMCPIKSR